MRNFLQICAFLVLISCPVWSANPSASYQFTSELQHAYELIQQLKITPARAILTQYKQNKTQNGVVPYLDNYADLHYLLISEDKDYYTRYSRNADERYNLLNSLPESPYKLLFQGEIKLHSAFIKLKFGNEISGCRDIIKAFGLLTQNRKKYPEFTPTLKSLGLLHVLIGCVPDQYAWVTRILGLNGDIAQGLAEIKEVQQKSHLFRHEAKLIDLMLHAYVLDGEPKATEEFSQLAFQQPENLLIHFLGSAVLKKEGKTDLAFRLVESAPKGAEYMHVPLLDYMKAEILLHQGKYIKAKDQYTRFLKDYQGFNFIKDSEYKIFICYWLNGQENSGMPNLQRVLTTGKAITEADQFAERFATKYLNEEINPEAKPLYAARYFSDGGYQEKAVEVLALYKESSFLQQINKAEFNYRKGRIYQKLSFFDRAIPYYKRAITLSEKNSYYFGAAASLQLGYVYENKSDKSQAINFFRKAISFKKHEYKNSIDNKAKAAISKLNR